MTSVKWQKGYLPQSPAAGERPSEQVNDMFCVSDA